MPHVVFVAPRFLENTNRYVEAFAELDGVTLSLISADPEEAIPRGAAPAHRRPLRVADSLDGAQLDRRGARDHPRGRPRRSPDRRARAAPAADGRGARRARHRGDGLAPSRATSATRTG